MPQVRDPKTGRYTSGGSSSVGGAAGTNPRIQKAKAVGGGATQGASNKAQLQSKLEKAQSKLKQTQKRKAEIDARLKEIDENRAKLKARLKELKNF